MAAPTNDNNTMDIDDDGNIVHAAQINIAQRRDNRSPAYQVLETAELVNNIVQYLPITSYPACSLINRVFREDIFFTSLTYKDSLLSAQHWIESKPRHIFILSAYILQYSADVDAGLPPGGALSNQFVFSCQTRSDGVDSYGSNGSNSDQRSGESSGHAGTSDESSGGVSHLQRHHTHQPGHDIEPFHSFHTYQSSATVPNVYFKTSSQLPPHFSSPPSLSPHPIAQQSDYSLPHQHHQTTTEFLPGQHVSTMNARATIAELSSSDLHHYEADISTNSNRSSMMVVDVADMSLSPSQILLPPHGLSTLPTPRQQQYHQQQYQQQQPMARVVPCPYELPTEGSMQYEESLVSVKKGSRTSTGSTNSHDSTISTSSSCSSNGEGHHGMSDPSSSSVSVLQGGAYSPYASPIMEESSNPSVFGSPYAVVGAGGGGGSVGSTSGARVGSARRGGGGQTQGSNSPGSARRSGKELAPEYQRESALQEHNQQLQQLQRQGGRRDEKSSRDDIPMTHIGDRGDIRMDTSNSHHHSHHHKHRHQERQRLSRQHQQQSPPNNTRPSENWSMAIQTFYYQNSALNAMIVACREHMLSPEGQGGAIILKTDTSRVIWNDTTRQEHIWTITPTLMDRTNPDFVEEDFDPDRDYA
ncbi:hypothetical protein KI688_003484 [Linnemannia hyalina]|uniref:Uncharacterized protein n=1 Tax=Linnemannia hyalina TaxID=64524 RepID=A0A9P7XNI1_9FUNG|nr:hypothetical protein KI688_003484 [Linnemannia hyalina]